jgi:hypothetical protein
MEAAAAVVAAVMAAGWFLELVFVPSMYELNAAGLIRASIRLLPR